MKGMALTVVYPTCPRWVNEEHGSRRCPPGIEPGGRRPSRPLARSKIAATARGRRSSSRRPAGRQSGSPPRSARGHPVRVFLAAILSGYAILLALTIAVGFLLTRVILKIDGVAAWDERVSRAIVRERTGTTVDLSWVGSTLAGGLVIPVLVGILLVVFLVSKHWRLAAFTLFVICVESGTYRGTSLVVHRDRPDVKRLESLPGRRQLPLGHTAASVALLRRPAASCSLRGSRIAPSGSPLVTRRRDPGVRGLVAHVARHAPPHRCRGRRADGHRRPLHHDLRRRRRGRRSARGRGDAISAETTEGKA